MVARHTRANFDSLRAGLRRVTKTSHDRLDAILAPLATGDRREYAAFLAIQFRVRAGIEQWASSNIVADQAPPPVAHLIGSDLKELGCPVPVPTRFELPPQADPIGLVWVIGGSALGNKSLLARRRANGQCEAERFLSDRETIDYFSRHLPFLEKSSSLAVSERAALAAAAVFDAFLAEAQQVRMDEAA